MLAVGIVLSISLATPSGPSVWTALAPGVALTRLKADAPTPVGDKTITVVRVDPKRWRLTLVTAQKRTDNRTARAWAKAEGLVLATNAGMFDTDFRTHVGYMANGDRIHTQDVNHYRSVAAFDPRGDAPPFGIFDLDAPDTSMVSLRKRYRGLIQNLRLIKKPGANRWSVQTKRWSEAALGQDRQGRILFVFARSPYPMYVFNRQLLASDLGVVALQHLEGGPEAQLYVKVGATELELFGSYETGFRDDDSNDAAWPIPNVIGIRPASSGAGK